MPFVKLDCGILTSTLWMDRTAREVFITALLMAEPAEFSEPVPQIATRSLDYTGWSAPPGWYGFVPAASVGIIRTAGVDLEAGKEALERLGSADEDSRSSDFEGRRLIRIDGGYLILNYMKYRDRDYTGADRQRRYRQRLRDGVTSQRNGVTSRESVVVTRHVTQAEAEAEADKKRTPLPPKGGVRGEGKGMQEALATPGLNTAAFQRWVEYRTEIRKPLKPTSLKAAAAELAKHTGQQSAVVQQSIANGWQGLFALKTQNGRPPPEPPKERREPTEEEVTEAQRKAREDNLRQLQRIGLAATKEVPR